MSRTQADEIALAVDNHWPSRTASKGGPLSNDVFARNAIASGGIVGPAGESASVRRTDWWVGLAVLVLIGLAFISVAFLWRA